MKIDGAIFDLDGTILDSMSVWDTAGEAYLLRQGITPHENLNETFKSLSLYQAAEYLQCEYGITDSVNKICDEINHMIAGFYMEEAPAKPGIKELLGIFKMHSIKMCVATATDRYLAKKALERNDLLEFFSEIFTCSSVGAGKDNPKIYLAALTHLNTKKEYTFVFEDALHAIQTARKAGFPIVGVFDCSEKKNQEEIKQLSDLYIHSWKEMRRILYENGLNNCRFGFQRGSRNSSGY